jgi:putative mycofactocin binding protein MftB
VSTSPAPEPPFDAGRPYALHPDLALRHERFGALAYHYGNRRLTFLKSPQLTAIVEALGDHPSVEAALDAHHVGAERRPQILRALARLESSEVISVR